VTRLKEFDVGVGVEAAHPTLASEVFSARVRLYAANHAEAVKLVMDELQDLAKRTEDEFLSDGHSQVRVPGFAVETTPGMEPCTPKYKTGGVLPRQPQRANPGRPTGGEHRPWWRRALNV
jgi:hypothetical protein